ncbi:MAG TPA: hypothetical protein VHO48_14135 [Anaerolineaceae bacterium]|nr:hypothetical protein [Anaerolineaceae bacterium]
MHVDPNKLIIALCLIGALVLVVNVGLWAYYRRMNPGQQSKGIQNAARRMQSPWGDEDEDLKRLNNLANDLRDDRPNDTPPSEPKERDRQ